jgi:CRP-like cAMP-binding protein
MTDNGAKELPIGPSQLEWLGSVLGLYAVSDRPALEEIVSCLPSMKLLQFEAGTVMVSEGDPGEDLYMLFKGEADVSRSGKHIAKLGPGDFFGEIGFLVSIPRTATVKASKSADVFRIHSSDFDEVLERYPKLMEAIRTTAKQRMQKLKG